jgi:ribonuclease-3
MHTATTPANNHQAAESSVPNSAPASAGTAPASGSSSSAPTDELLAVLGTTIEPELLVQALTHRSFSHEHAGAANYERLEFLGDAVLELVSTETLYRLHPDMNEGQLAKMRAKAVSEEALSQIAREKLHVGPYILLGNGEAESGGADKSSILCDIVESLIGATFVQHGIDEARAVVHRLIDDTLEEVSHEGPALDWKTSLTVKAHQLGLEDPQYRMAVSGPEYAQTFTARAVLPDNDEVLGTGSGTSKRKAQLAAAQEAWKALDVRSSRHAKH